MTNQKVEPVSTGLDHPQGNHNHRKKIMTDLQALAAHIASNYGIDVQSRTRLDATRLESDFEPLDSEELLEVFDELMKCVDITIEAGATLHDPTWLSVVADDGEETFIRENHIKPEHYPNALMVAAAKYSAIKDAEAKAVEDFVALALKACNAGCELPRP